MENRCYVVIISSPILAGVTIRDTVKCYPETYQEAIEISRPWIEQGYAVSITTEEDDFIEDEEDFIQIPLDTSQYIEKLTVEQSGAVFKNIFTYFFKGTEPKCDDNIIQDATIKFIKRIKEYMNNNEQ